MTGWKITRTFVLCAGAALAVSACTTHRDETRMVSVTAVERVDQTANRALTTANAAKVSADQNAMTAQRALEMAQQAQADAKAANEKADRMFQSNLRK